MLILFVASGSWAEAATYFVKNGGSDAADGLSDANAWANISKVNSTAFSAGDTINFRRGSTWTGTTLVIDSSGRHYPSLDIHARTYCRWRDFPPLHAPWHCGSHHSCHVPRQRLWEPTTRPYFRFHDLQTTISLLR
jgi:hypothetical protein